MRPAELITSALLFAAATHAWPWVPVDAIKRDLAPMIVARDGPTSTFPTVSAKETSKDTKKTSATDSPSGTGSRADSSIETGTKSAKSSGKAKSTSKIDHQTTKTYDARLPAGGVQMLTPAPTAAATYYKISNDVTFAWNYTSLLATPSAVDVLASCSLNSEIYTIAANQTITNATQALTWDTGAFQTSADVVLLTAEYTLIIHDAAKDISATAQAGYLGTFAQFTFGMYQPQASGDFTGVTCVTCSGALSAAERQALNIVFGTAVLTVLSFSWFTGVVGLW